MNQFLLAPENPIRAFSNFIFKFGVVAGSNLPPISTTQEITLKKFATDVVDTGGGPSLANISANFQKNFNDPNTIFKELRENDSSKNQKQKSGNAVPLKFTL
jgi:hypothetical protein